METIKIQINGAEKEVQISWTYTRKIDREFNEILFQGVKTNPWMSADSMNLDFSNVWRANDYLVKSFTNLNDQELDEISSEDYNEILKKITEKIKTPWK